jgi:hypothetical protein
MTGAVVATAIVFFPAAPLFFFMKGKNIEIPKGTEITAFTAAATPVNLATQNVAEASAAPTSAAETAPVAPETSIAANPDFAIVLIKSDPAGADITIDEKFMGTTQSSIKLSSGEHTITITKAGYKEWKRTITVGQGSEITLDAVMEKIP